MRYFVILAMIVLDLRPAARASAGYLATVGPVALRLVSRPQLAPQVLLPPLQMDDSATREPVSEPSSVRTSPAPSEPSASKGLGQSKSTETAPPLMTEPRAHRPAEKDVDMGPAISPQM